MLGMDPRDDQDVMARFVAEKVRDLKMVTYILYLTLPILYIMIIQL